MDLQVKTKETYKILLVSINNLWRYSNVGVDQIAGYLRMRGFYVDIFYHHKNLNYDEIAEKLPCDYDLYGFSVNSSNYPVCVRLANHLKMCTSDVRVIFGGGYPTRYHQEIFASCGTVDCIILGDGEVPLENFLNHIILGEELRYKANMVFPDQNDGKTPYCNGVIEHFPVWDYFENDSRARNRRKEYCLQTKNNVCTGKCTFCTERKGTIVYKEISHIVREVDTVYRNFGIRKFFFTDDNIMDPNDVAAKERVGKLCDAIRELGHGLVFKCYIKANSLHDIPEDNALLKKMSDVGFKTIFVGIEAGNPADLLLYNKLTTVEENYSILRMLRKYEIAPQIGFINFNPYSTLETIRQNYDFLVNAEIDNLFMYICSYMRVYKYTAMHRKIVKDGLALPEEDYLDDKSMYRFADDGVQRLFDFIKEYMLSRVRNLDFEFDWLYSFFLECRMLDSDAAIYQSELDALRKCQLEKLKTFFYILFVENDLDKGRSEVDAFLSFFEQLQPRFAELHRNLLELYVRA